MNTLVIQTAYLGDVILTVPLLCGIRRADPGGRITLLTTPDGARMASLVGVVDEVVTLDKRGAERGVLALLGKGLALRRKRFDAVFSPHRSLRSGIVARLTGAPRRHGFSSGPASRFMTDTVSHPGVEHGERAIASLLGPAGLLAAPDAAAEAERPAPPCDFLRVPAQELEIARSRIGGGMIGGPLVTLIVGSAWETKRWPVGRFAMLARGLANEGVHVAIEGGPGDVACGKEIRSIAGEYVTDLTGNSLTEAAAVISISDLVIGGDTGLTHLARMADRPVLAIFGPTDHSIHVFGPRQKAIWADLPCRPCSRHGPSACPEKHFGCMHALSPETMLHEALQLLEYD